MTDPLTPADATVSVGDVVVTPPKNPLASTAIWGLIVIIAARLAAKYLPDDLRQPAVDATLEVLSWAVGPLLVLYGRWTANRPLGIGGPMKTTIKVIAPLLLALSLTGCANLSVPADWVKADRKTYDAIAPEYVDYVAADTRLSATQKANRQNDVKSWESRIVEHEKATAAKAGQ